MAAIYDFLFTQTSDSIRTNPVVLPDPRKHGYSRWNLIAIKYAIKDICVTHILPIYGRHFELRLQFSSAVITVISGISAVLKI